MSDGNVSRILAGEDVRKVVSEDQGESMTYALYASVSGVLNLTSTHDDQEAASDAFKDATEKSFLIEVLAGADLPKTTEMAVGELVSDVNGRIVAGGEPNRIAS